MKIRAVMIKLAAALQAGALVIGLTSGAVAGVAVSAAPVLAAGTCAGGNIATSIDDGAACSKGQSQKEDLFGSGGIFTVIANTLVFIIGAISVIYIIIGGLRYVTSNGDSKAVSTAKDTILYAVIGVIVAVVSYAIINFVLTSLKQAGS